MRYFIYIVIMLPFFSVACSEDQVYTYGRTEYIYFNDLVLNYSFALSPGVSTVDIPLEVKLIGNSVAYDREIVLEIDSMGTNVDNTDFELLPARLGAGRYSDTIYVRLYKSEKFKENVGFVRLAIQGNEYFMPGPTGSVQFSLTFSDILLQPAWWDKAIEKDYLGVYSEKKYRYFIIANNGVSDLSTLGSSEKRAYTLIFLSLIHI